ncbi:MAG TPA: cytochrome c1 [Gammaproteobacteria bacterium]|jgi:ubiquinol-cytochrome c reductase cytochrome c1 subunit
MILRASLLLTGLCLSMTAFGQHAGVGAPQMEPADNDVGDIASLQRGAKFFVNYCLGCHSAQYVRYNRIAADLGLTEDQLVENLMFTGQRPFDTMDIAMRKEDAVRWFGVAPPDLSLIARSRGVDYLYNFLRGFYRDESTATGANNLWLENTAMPHVLWELQGMRGLVAPEAEAEAAQAHTEFEMVRPGTLAEGEFDVVVRDIVNFLDYIGEPMQLERRALGIRVIAFLLVFLLIAYMLKREIWKDVH